MNTKAVLLVLALCAVCVSCDFDLGQSADKLFDQFMLKFNKPYDPKKNVAVAVAVAKKDQPQSKFAKLLETVKIDMKQATDWSMKKLQNGYSTFKNDIQKLEAWVKKEYNDRKAIFTKNLEKIKLLNKKSKNGLKFGITQFSDLEASEFMKLYTVPNMKNAPKLNLKLLSYDKKDRAVKNFDNKPVTPDVIGGPERDADASKQSGVLDYRTKGLVTTVKNQGQCGSCWAFATSGVLEGQYAKSKGQMIDFSPQSIVDCATNGNFGCDGGFPVNAMNYAKSDGVARLSDYAYKGVKGECQNKLKAVYKVTDAFAVNDDEAELKKALETYGPIATCFHVTDDLQHYTGGIFSDSACPTQANHAVLLVGYGEENGKKYWLLKNSWDTWWGEKGYFRLERGTHMCGIGALSAGANGIAGTTTADPNASNTNTNSGKTSWWKKLWGKK